MRVIHVIPSIVDEASGPSYSVPRLCESLISAGADSSIVALGTHSIAPDMPYVRTFTTGRGPRRFGISPTMRDWLAAEVASGRVDVIHSHGLWMMPNVYPARACRGGHAALVVSPRGTLSPWALKFKAMRKKAFWHLLQAKGLRAAACFHATATSEYDDIRRLGFRQPVCVLPNGIDVPSYEPQRPGSPCQLLYLGRIHEKKGIDTLLRAWCALEGRFPDWELRIVGPDDGRYLRAMQTLAAQLGLRRAIFSGPAFGHEKLQAYRQASLFVLPSHSENFGMTVAEALAAGTPAVVTQGAPWQGLEREGAGWWIPFGVDSLVLCLEEALTMPPAQLHQMGLAGREWMARDYSWEAIGEALLCAYSWLLRGGEPPPWVWQG